VSWLELLGELGNQVDVGMGLESRSAMYRALRARTNCTANTASIAIKISNQYGTNVYSLTVEGGICADANATDLGVAPSPVL
jgi:hypothetical protein